MATYHLWSGGSNTSPYDTWAKAATTYTTALAAATASGDIIKVHKTHTEELGVDTVYTHQNHISVICVDKDASDALATMGDSAWIGNSTLNRTISIAGAFRLFFYGITLRIAGGTSDFMNVAVTDGQHVSYEACTFWHGSTTTANLSIGALDCQIFAKLTNCVFRFGAVSQGIAVSAMVDMVGCSLHASSAVITGGLIKPVTTRPGGAIVKMSGCDWSLLAANVIVASATSTAHTTIISQCKLGSGYVALATQTNLNRSSAEVYIFDCSSGDTHGLSGYFNAMGSVVSDGIGGSGIYLTAGAAGQSWKIVTTANCSFYTPFETPWFGYRNATLSALTPYVEILRDGSATAYQDDEVWLDVMAKVTASSTQSTFYTDRMALLGTPANQAAGAGLGSWTGESGTAWSGKIGLASSITPAEVGHIQARIVVGEPSITVYADPQIRV
jgi:hypothetical protein